MSQQPNNLAQMGKPITAAFHDAQVALGLAAPTQRTPRTDGEVATATAGKTFGIDANPVLTVAIDASSAAARVWLETRKAESEFWINRSFRSVALESVQDNGQVRYSTVSALGRPEDYYVYTGNANRMLPLRVSLVPYGPSGSTGNPYEDVITPALWLTALTYPVTNQAGKSSAPPPLLVTLGGVAFFRAILTTCNVRWVGPWSADSGEWANAGFGNSIAGFVGNNDTENGRVRHGSLGHLIPHGAEVDLVFTQVTAFGHGHGSHNFSMTPWRLGSKPQFTA